MEEKNEDKGKRLLGYAFNYSVEVAPGETFQVTGSLLLDASLAQVNAEFDKFQAAGSRQKVKSLRRNLEEGIAQLELQVSAWTDNLAILDERSNKGQKLAGNERAQREQFVASLKNDRAQLEHKKKVLAEVLKELK